MKSYCKGLVIDEGHVRAAFDAWANGESGRKNRHRVTEEHGSESALIDEIFREIRGRSLRFRPIHRYRRVEPTNGKVRVIGVESVKQQVVDYLAVTLLEPLYQAKVGYYQVASVKGKGQRLCRRSLRRWVRGSKYHVKLDIRQCYPSTSHQVVYGIYSRYVRSDDVLYVISALLGTYTMGGLEIGSYFSLRSMQLVLSFGYHHVESLGRRRRGRWVPHVRHQIWHMDDVLLISNNKSALKSAARSLAGMMESTLGLSVKSWKLGVVSEREPLDLGGWVVRPSSRHRGSRVTLRGGTFLRATRAYRSFEVRPTLRHATRCASYWGHMAHADCEGAIMRRNIRQAFARARHLVSAHDKALSRKA